MRHVRALPYGAPLPQASPLSPACLPACLLARPQDEKGASKGFGFINYKDSDSAARCVDALNMKELNGKELFVGRAQKKTERDALLRQK